MRRRQQNLRSRRHDSSLREARLIAEAETVAADISEAEKVTKIELRRLAGAEALGEVSESEASAARSKIEVDLQDKRDRLALLHDAVPEIAQRAAEQEAEARRREFLDARSDLKTALMARHGAGKVLDSASTHGGPILIRSQIPSNRRLKTQEIGKASRDPHCAAPASLRQAGCPEEWRTWRSCHIFEGDLGMPRIPTLPGPITTVWAAAIPVRCAATIPTSRRSSGSRTASLGYPPWPWHQPCSTLDSPACGLCARLPPWHSS